MKGIKLELTVKYTAGVTMTVSDEVFESLQHMEARWPDGFDTLHIDHKCDAAMDFLADNISERDACEWEYEINDLEEINDDDQV